MIKTLTISFILLSTTYVCCQSYSHADSLHGGLPPERTAFDVYYYDLSIDVDPFKKLIVGSVDIYFKIIDTNTNSIQVDLYNELTITSVKDANGDFLEYHKDGNAYFIFPNIPFSKNDKTFISIEYEGAPLIATNPPWEGGWVWKEDKNGYPWIGVACEGEGASIWWPNKDTWSDEADSVAINLTCPSDLVGIANGNLRGKMIDGEKTTYQWFVSYPINNYNVTVYIGKFVNFSETFEGIRDTFQLDYYVLDYNLKKAKKQFKQVAPVLKSFEQFLGPFPFPKDGYGLVESPFEGMEHQGAIAYGNGFEDNYKDYRTNFLDISLDHIIVHETGHEFWGNSVTGKDNADMWIHEGFCTYTESFYVEFIYGKEEALKFCNGWRDKVLNDRTIVTDYEVFQTGSSRDMYCKAALMLHTLRWIVNDDNKWFTMLKNIQKDYYLKIVTTDELIVYINNQLGDDYTWLFDQYLKVADAPELYYELEQTGNDLEVKIIWNHVLKDFRLPVTVIHPDGNFEIYITNEPQRMIIANMRAKDFKVDQMHSYFELSPNITSVK